MPNTSPLRVLSLGAGVQSTTLALMAAHGDIGPMPDCAIFADTGWEPKAVYEHLAFLQSGILPFPIHIVQSGNIKDDLLNSRSDKAKGGFYTIPFFIVNPDGSKGMGRRQCTNYYKLLPITKKLRELLGVAPGKRIAKDAVEMWIGISVDEAVRMKPAKEAWKKNRWPLIERGMTRNACLQWMQAHDYALPPKSACIGCPFRNTGSWRQFKADSPEEFDEAVKVDRQIRHIAGEAHGEVFMHPQCIPLDKVDLGGVAGGKDGTDLFGNECEGMCGV